MKFSSIEKYMKRKVSLTRYAARERRNLEFDIDYMDLIKLWDKQKGLCAISYNPMSLEHGGEFMSGTNPYACTIDRIDNDKGYLKNNIQLVICAHNLWRNNLPLTEYKKLLGQING